MPFEFEIFKPGEYPQGVFTPEQVQQMVADYDPNLCEAPVTLDHVQWGQAFGWVKGVRLGDGDVVVADLDLHPLLYSAYKNGEYRKRSIEIISRLEDTGRPYIGAVTFLGAMNPQVKGLADPVFANPEARIFVDYEAPVRHAIHDNSDTNDKGGGNMSKLKDALKKMFSSSIDQLDESQLGIEATPSAPDTGDAGKNVDARPNTADQAQMSSVADRERFARIEAENADLKKQLAESQDAKRKDRIHTFCENLKSQGKLLPAWQEAGLEQFMLALEANGKIEFAMGEKDARDGAEFFAQLLSSMPKLVEFDEIAPRGGDMPAESEEHEFMEISRQYAKDNDCSMTKAMAHVAAKQPELHDAFLDHQRALSKQS